MYIGIDLGGTNIAVGIVDKEGKILLKKSAPTLPERGYAKIIKDMASLALEVVKDSGFTLKDIAWIGIGSPGMVDKKNGVLIYANNLNFDHVPMKAEMQKYTDPRSASPPRRSGSSSTPRCRRQADLEVMLGALHATEHAQIAVLPLLAMCDRWDIGGLSTNHHPQTGAPTIFIYDGHPGGIGIARTAFTRFEELCTDAHALICECACADGCPSCVQSPKCGNLNEPLSKAGARVVLARMLHEGAGADRAALRKPPAVVSWASDPSAPQ